MPYCRWASSLGKLEGTALEAWGTLPYAGHSDTVFFGLYDLRDYLALALHRGRRWVLWAGSDIKNLQNDFLLNDGKLKWLSKILGNPFRRYFKRWLADAAEHWVENEMEAEALRAMGIPVAGVCPSFLGKIEDFEDCFRPNKRLNVYVSASEGRQEEYGFDVVERIAPLLPWMRFHLYGAEWQSVQENVIVHGRVPKAVMNEEIRDYQIGLRLNRFDGFSEILAKAVLMGHQALSAVPHPHIPSFNNDLELVITLNALSKIQHSNPARAWYRENLNRYPWCL